MTASKAHLGPLAADVWNSGSWTFGFLWMLLLLCLLGLGSQPAQAAGDDCSPVPLKSLNEQLGLVTENIDLVDYPAALKALEKTERLLPCVNEVVPTTTLARIYLVRGLTMFYLDNKDGAKSAFVKALALEPTLRWDPAFGQKARETFQDARDLVIGRKPSSVKVPPLAKGVKVFVDGKAIVPDVPLELLPGAHLLQIQWTSGLWDGFTFETSAGRELPLPLPEQALAGAPRSTSSGGKPPPSAPSSSDSAQANVPLIAFGGLAVAGLVSTVGFGYLWNSTALELTQYFSNETDPTRVEERERLLRLNAMGAWGTDASLVVTALATGGTVYFFLNPPEGGQARRSIVPVFTPSYAGLVLQGSF